MSIRLKIVVILVVAVVMPLAISVYFWIGALQETLGDNFRLSTLVRPGELKALMAKRAEVGVTRRTKTTTSMLGSAVKGLDRDLDRLDCVATAARDSEPCRKTVEEFLGFHREDINGIRVSIPGQRPWGRHEPVVPEAQSVDVEAYEAQAVDAQASEAQIREIEAKLDELERGSEPVTMHPVRTAAGLIFVTTRFLERSERLTVWGTFGRLRKDLQQLGSSRATRLVLVGRDYHLLDSVQFWSRRKGSTELAETATLADWIKRGTPGVVRVGGADYIGKYTVVPKTRLGVLIVTSLDDFGRTQLVNVLGVQIVLMIAGLIVAVALTDRSMKRLRRLRDAADEIGGGNLEAEIHVTGHDEIGRLAERFRVMASQLREHITTLEQKVETRTRDLRLKAEELGRANEDLVRLTKLKSDFLARMSHELRTPLNSIIGFSDLLLTEGCGPINEEQRDGLDRVMRNGKNLLQLINDILDLTKIEADRLILKLGPVPLRTVVDNAVSALMLRAADKKIALTTAVDPDLPALYTDEVRLLQILNNLLSNAVKFTERGGVTLTARGTAAGVVIAVQDSGIGISAEDLPKLFTEFYQTDSGRARKYEGTGLGLAITRRLAEALGGTATVTSELGVGSTFTVTLPLVAPSTPDEPKTSPGIRIHVDTGPIPRPLDRPATILVVDDDPATHLLMAEHLKPIGARLLAETTGAGGLDTAYRERPDLILLDVRLPDRHGWEVLHDLKAHPVTADIPVIIISAVDRESLGFSLGAADYIVKPVNWDLLYRMLKRLGIAQGGNVLVVDDDGEQVALLRRALESRGFAVREARDGIQALVAARERRPDLIVLDLLMPIMDGFDALTHLRSDPRTTGVPVVVLTAKDLTDADRARLSGKVDALFQKHRVPLDQLVGEVRSLIWKGSGS